MVNGWTLDNSALALGCLCSASCCLDSLLDWTEGNESETHGFEHKGGKVKILLLLVFR